MKWKVLCYRCRAWFAGCGRKNIMEQCLVRLRTLYQSFGEDAVFYINGSEVLPAPLEPEEEARALALLKSSEGAENERVKNMLVERNLRLVVYIARKFETVGAGVEDLISIGTIGLIKAVNTFRPDRNIKLATYASRCIENEILMFFRNQKKTAQDVFISDPIDTDKDGNTLTLIDVIADKSDIADEIDTKIKVEKLRVILPVCLTERERLIIEMRYGLCGREELTQREIAKKLNISRSYVSRIEKSALEKLRKQF